jgi:hypothetical protein
VFPNCPKEQKPRTEVSARVVIHKSSALFLALFGYNFVGLIRGYEHHLASNRLVLDRKITEGISGEDL